MDTHQCMCTVDRESPKCMDGIQKEVSEVSKQPCITIELWLYYGRVKEPHFL